MKLSSTKPLIKIDEETSDFASEIVERGAKIFPKEELERLLTCIQCGTCYGSCPSGRITAYNVRVIMRKAQLGLKEEVLKDENLWNCTTCYTCQERCPREVETTDTIRLIRNMAFEAGYVKKPHLIVSRNFIQTGHSIPLRDEDKEKRKRVDVPEVPPTTLTFLEALKEVQTLVEATGFKEKVLKLLEEG